ncbi:hypothetical protein Sp245p_26805 (plasmid) [Azospirillum baldaniorum]|uniref:Uncharacterized protein n=1 Tax=Azospirillum baldaniorum TaxID=1064539 RepID=A0A9P1NSA7_9PROT|nr:hypothetical protein [Azospirillum baldaniorum]AWJ93471.1 hypothetical protein Sp245p_26805 [Azospirillum baldaniorum]TWA71702.1 lipopolysaccharide biosynthesis glycosyltransferase [Azospirillum brasilense]CCD03972.1 conserved protein of unknown function [Azospirillum baldaniorum]
MPRTHHFYTYFDRNYLPRGLILRDSLRASGVAFRLNVLCLDPATACHFAAEASGDTIPVPLAELEAADPALAAVKSQRSTASYYFTLTGAFGRFLFDRNPAIGQLTYLDADIQFFGSPETVFEEIGDAPVAIVPHRFSDRNAAKRRYGLFNVGWITWRRHPVGFACLDDYRAQCLEWCHDYMDGDRFADQRYLDVWPSVYPGLHVIAHKGANLAPWNLDSQPLELRDGRILADGQPLVFYHFHRLRQTGAAAFKRNLGDYLANPAEVPGSAVVEAIYRPYEEQLTRLSPLATFATVRSVPSCAEPALPAWEYRPQGWQPEADAPGWNAPAAMDALTDRLAIVQRRQGTTLPVAGDARTTAETMVLGYAAARAATPEEPLTVLDWHGGLGIHQEALDLLLPRIRFEHHCRATPALAERGRGLVPQATFHDSDAAAFARRYDLVIARGSLHQSEHWREDLRRLAAAAGKLLVVLRLPVVSSVPSFVLLHRVAAADYTTSWQGWAVNLVEFLKAAADEGLEFDRQMPVEEMPCVQGAPEQPELRGFLFRRGAV